MVLASGTFEIKRTIQKLDQKLNGKTSLDNFIYKNIFLVYIKQSRLVGQLKPDRK